MLERRSPPPEAEACLVRRYASSQKGGTLIRGDVTDPETHERYVRTGRYRPERCPRCGASMHVHDYRPRWLREGPETTRTTRMARFRCADRRCRAIFQVLPGFVARRLWRAWEVVERASLGERNASEVPARTVRRWRARLEQSARLLVTTVAAAGAKWLDRLAGAVGLEGTRRQLVLAHAPATGAGRGTWIASLAELVHRLAAGVRVM